MGLGGELQVGLVHEAGRGQGVVAAARPEMAVREHPQVVIDQRNQRIEGRRLIGS
jgi:hypothetical protein